MSIDLNIKSRGVQGTKWKAENKPLKPEDLDGVREYSSDNGKALNSLPTPFARFFIFKEAFRRVKEEYLHPNNPAGEAYKRLVSDCLDLYELLFNYKHHKNVWGENSEIEILEWDKAKNMERMKDSNKLLADALNDTYDHDIAEPTLYFIIYKKDGRSTLLGTSSPFTGLITPPDMDKEIDDGRVKFIGTRYQNLNLQRKSGGKYFQDTLLFGERDTDFKNFMYRLFTYNNVDSKYSEIIRYFEAFRDNDEDIRSNYPLVTTEVLSVEGAPVVINGLALQQNDEIDINSYFQPYIIRIPYKLSETEFEGVKYKRPNSNRSDDYLIPLKAEGLSLLSRGATYSCQVKTSGVEIELVFNGFTYKKTYEESPSDMRNGKIKDLVKDNQYVNIGLFPNILSHREQENNYFKVVLAETEDAQNYLTLDIEHCSLSFFKKNSHGNYDLIPEVDASTKASDGVYKATIRSKQNSNQNGGTCGTKYYEIFNTSFDAIEIEIGEATGMVLPIWRRSDPTADSYTYAIDLGTSNTFISRKKEGSNDVPVQLELKDPMVSYLHAYSKEARYSAAYRIENSLHKMVRNTLITEFAPAQIDGREYDLPIRTALCQVRGVAQKASLFSNTNIAFFYEKAIQSVSQEVTTDIKWDDNKEKLSCFIQELMLIIKVDVLQHNGLLNQTKLVRFRPLSFNSSTRNLNDSVWNAIPEQVFGVKPLSTVCYTESEAPYYYFTKSNIITNTNSVAVVDIGGGSTDIVYFESNKPLAASSIHFGCDVLWGEGHNTLNHRNNGIYMKYNNTFVMPDDIEKVHSAMNVDASVSAKDMINFWLNNQKHCEIIGNLRRDYAPLFVYHFTSIIFYMAIMYKHRGFAAPRTFVFSGNGSKYIDNFITSDTVELQHLITLIFEEVYGKLEDPIYVILPAERKENTCYGGLYRDATLPPVPEFVYHGTDKEYSDAASLIKDSKILKDELMKKYQQMNKVYCKVITTLKNHGVIDRTMNVSKFLDAIDDQYRDNLDTHFRSEVEQVYTTPGDVCNDSVFFIPIIDKIFSLTKA